MAEYILKDEQGLYVAYVYKSDNAISIGRTPDPAKAWRMSLYEADVFSGSHRSRGLFTYEQAPTLIR